VILKAGEQTILSPRNERQRDMQRMQKENLETQENHRREVLKQQSVKDGKKELLKERYGKAKGNTEKV
jgi:hypothetical protein